MVREPAPDRAPAYGWFSEGYQASTAGIAEDFRVVMDDRRSDLAALATPPVFIHGARDPLVPLHRIEGLIEEIGIAHLRSFDGGHFVSATAAAEVWKQVASLV